MHLIVNISELQYETIMKSKILKDVKADYIRNAIVLPKGHGRLVDMNVALKVLADEWGYEGIEDDLEYKVPTIIEADKENKE